MDIKFKQNIFLRLLISRLNNIINKKKKMFCLNGYPSCFFNKVLNKSVSNITVDRSTDCRFIIIQFRTLVLTRDVF